MYHNRLLHFTLKKELGEIYISIFLRSFAISLIGVFIPIYLLKEVGVSFNQLLIYYIITFITLAFAYPISAKLCSKFGVKHIILLSVPFYIIFYFLLYNLLNYEISIYLLGFVLGLGDGLFWYAYSADFAKCSDKKHRTEEVRFWFIVASLIGIVAPFIGGYLLSLSNFYILFGLVIILFIFSIVPLLMSKDIVLGHDFTISDIIKKENFENFFLYYLQGVRGVIVGIFWPLFIFFILEEYFSLGLIISGAALVSSISVWFVANYIDKINKVKFSEVGTLIDGIITFFRSFVRDFLQITAVTILGGITSYVVDISMSALGFDQANKTDVGGFLIFREMVFTLGRLSLLLAILLIGLDSIASLKLGFFILAGLSIVQNYTH